MNKAYFFVKRILDIILACIALIILLPFFAIFAIIIKLESPGAILFKQKRIGKNKKIFTIYKFRTMRTDTPKDMPTHMLKNADSYITKFGNIMRKTSIDELPQIFNILKGDMSIIGPRPALWNQEDLIAKRDEFNANSIRPGLTGLAQVNGRDELPIEVKAKYDGEYAENISFILDVKIFLKTIINVFKHEGIVEGEQTEYNKVTIINCFETARDRVKFVKEYFERNNYLVNIIQSDFSHMKKEKIKDIENGITYINTWPYKKNISFARILSHYKFAKDTFKKAKELGQDIIYIILPPNFLAKCAKKYKKNNKNVKVIFDIYDLWPESIPSEKIKKFLKIPCKVWKNIRDKNINTADIVITECDLYRKSLEKSLSNVQSGTVYLTREDKEQFKEKYEKINNCLELLYLGSINNLIDIDLIIEFLSKIKSERNIKLNIIGEGEKTDIFVKELQKNEIKYKYYGPVYDEFEKATIFNKCDFGINIMKKGISVGLTMKSLDYFSYGIPILNNINGDTARLIEQYNAGVNLNDNLNQKIEYICNISNEELVEMHRNVDLMFKEKFCKEKVREEIDKLLKGVIIHESSYYVRK